MWIVPSAWGYEVDGEPTTIILGHVGFLKVRQGGLPWMVWNVYFPPGPEGMKMIQTTTEWLEANSAVTRSHIQIGGGDFNCDYARPSDQQRTLTLNKLLEKWNADRRCIEGHTYVTTHGEAIRESNIDFFSHRK